jgi:hypothetical protein
MTYTIAEIEKEIDFTYFELEDMRETLPYKTFKAFEGFMLDHIQELNKQLAELQGG